MRTDEQLEALYASTNSVNHAAALRAVYSAGATDALLAAPEPATEPVETETFHVEPPVLSDAPVVTE